MKRFSDTDLVKPKRHMYLRDIPARWFDEEPLPEKFAEFAEWALLPQIEFSGYKIAEKKRIAMHCLHRLIGTGLSDRCVMDTRDPNKGGDVRMRVEVWDAIEAAGFAITCIGSESSEKVTRYAATEKLLNMEKVWKLYLTTNLKLDRNTERETPTKHALVCVRRKSEILPLKSTGAITEIAQLTENILEEFNRNNLDHTWKAINDDGHAFQPNPCLRQVYASSFWRLGRFYTFGDVAAQSLSKSVRRNMRIDGKRTAELDLEGSLIRMIYHRDGIDPNPEEDIYKPAEVFRKLYAIKKLAPRKQKIIRNFVKKATIICLNTKSRPAANSSVGKALAEHKHREFLHKAIYNIENTTPKGIVRRIVKAHAPIADDFFSETGVWMMTREAQIMQSVMSMFTLAGKPALFIHDAVVVKRCDVDFAREQITSSYRRYMPFDPVIRQAY